METTLENNPIASEINGLRSDRIISERNLSNEQRKWAESVLNGLGDDVINTLSTPVEKIEVKKENKIKKFFKKLIRTCS